MNKKGFDYHLSIIESDPQLARCEGVRASATAIRCTPGARTLYISFIVGIENLHFISQYYYFSVETENKMGNILCIYLYF